MAKILLVEDDNNLSEIYQARLQAEGYEIVSAHDGEEALALAAKEKPDLIISDVMMPKISGFEMLDILRNTDGLKTTKVIMLTALGQAEDKTRAESMGADRYLVKSQVTLEDIVKAAKDLLDASGSTTPMPNVLETPPAAPVAAATAVPTPVIPAPAKAPTEPAKSTQPAPATPAFTPVASDPAEPAKAPVAMPEPRPEPAKIEVTNSTTPELIAEPQPTPISTPYPAVTETKTEAVAEDETKVADAASTQSTADEEARIKSQIESFVQTGEASDAATTTPEVAPEPIKAESTTPTVPEPEPEQSDTPPPAVSEEGDKVVVDAVDNLLANTSDEPVPTIDEPQPAKPESSEPAPDIEVPEMPKAVYAPADMPAAPEIHSKQPAVISPTGKAPEGDNVAIAHKKIISPISNPNPRPDLDTLLAQEEVNSGGSVLSVPVVVSSMDVTPPPSSSSPAPATHQPGSVYGPQNGDVPAPNDPSSIAL